MFIPMDGTTQDNIRGKRSEYITEMHTDMDSLGYKERQLQGVLSMYLLQPLKGILNREAVLCV